MAEGLAGAAGGARCDAGVDSRAAVAESKQAMSFLDELRAHLRAGGLVDDVVGRRRAGADVATARRHAFEALERDERAGALDRSLTALRHWETTSDWFDRFCAHAEGELSGGLCAGSDAAALQRSLHAVVDSWLSAPRPPLTTRSLREREFDRLSSRAAARADLGAVFGDVPRYSFENLLERGADDRASVTPAGRVFLDLPDGEAVRWLLTLEALLSTRPDDVAHTSRESLGTLLQGPAHLPDARHHTTASGDPARPPGAVLLHLSALGVVDQWQDARGVVGYTLVPAYRETLEDLASGRRTPLTLLAESLLAEERASVAGHALALPSPEFAAELQARHASMVVHEIRNTVVPMNMALSGIFRTLEESAPEERWRSQRERVERGVARFLRFAGDLEKIVRIGAPVSQPFDLVSAVHDAIKGLNGGLGLAVTFDPDVEPLRVVGHRAHFTLVVINLLRNAAQNNPSPGAAVRLTAGLTAAPSAIELAVDDNGPGVPEEHREEIFRRGFALRPGGSGQGLALVREVVEREMRGKVHCESSVLGGARFVLSFPLSFKESS